MRFMKWILYLVSCAVLTSTSAKVFVDHDRTADFRARRTYAWMKGTEAPNTLVEKRIRAAVDDQLRAKGLTRVEGEADLHVITHATTTTGSRLDVTSYGYGGYVGSSTGPPDAGSTPAKIMGPGRSCRTKHRGCSEKAVVPLAAGRERFQIGAPRRSSTRNKMEHIGIAPGPSAMAVPVLGTAGPSRHRPSPKSAAPAHGLHP